MKTTWNNLFSCTLLALAIFAGSPARAQSLADYVDPFIGTSGMGHTFPGACVPFGGVQLSPDTDTIPHSVAGRYQPEVYSLCAGYRYDDPTIVGFSHTHLSGTGHSDLGDILIMPTTGPLQLNPGTADAPEKGYRSRYSHSSETAHPGYYAVTLEDYGIRRSLALPPERACIATRIPREGSATSSWTSRTVFTTTKERPSGPASG